MTNIDAEQSTTASDLLVMVFEALIAEKFNFVVLRNYENLPNNWRNDIDILIEPIALDKAHEIIINVLLTAKNSLLTESLKRLNYRASRCVCVDRELHIDLYSQLSKGWVSYADTGAILAAQRKYNSLFNIPDPTHELLLIAAKELFSYGKIRSRYHGCMNNMNLDLSHAAADLIFGSCLSSRERALIVKALTNPKIRGYLYLGTYNLFNFIAALHWARMRRNDWEIIAPSKKKSIL
jgi:hypothetical protein